MRAIVSALGLALAAATASASAQTPPVAAGCYARDYAKGAVAEGYSWVRIAVRPGKDAESEWNLEVSLKYAHASLPAANFETFRVCRRDGASILCPVECDGGTLRLRPLRNGDILLEADHAAIEESSLSTLLLPHKDASSFFKFLGTHVLRPAPAEHCSIDKDAGDETRVLFQPGDYHPRVALISKQLAQLGFLSAPSDRLYTRDTAAAMKAFQQSMGYEATGNADAKSVRALNVRALTTGAC